MMKDNFLPVIGSTEYVEIFGVSKIPAKIDTGADSSSVWVSNIKMSKDGVLCFCLFDKKSPLYTGEKIKVSEYVAKSVMSSNGEAEIRYKVKLPVKIKDLEFLTTFTLADRSQNKFPVLIGRKTLEGRFVVDVMRSEILRKKTTKMRKLNAELKNNPYVFHQKYMKKGVRI